jgi:membrane protease YdiL (CAAX protease family)
MTSDRGPFLPLWARAAVIAGGLFYILLILVFAWMPDEEEAAQRKDDRKKITTQLLQRETDAKKRLEENPSVSAAIALAFLVVFVAGVTLDARFLWRRRNAESLIPRAGSLPETRWSLYDVFLGVCFLFFSEAAFLAGQQLWLHFSGHPGGSDMLMIISSLLRDVCVVAFIWGLIRRQYGQDLDSMKFPGAWSGQVFKTAALSYAAIIPPLILCFLIVSRAVEIFSVEPMPQNVVQIYLKDSTQSYWVILTFFVALLGPVLEEIFFRGFVYSGMKKRFGVAGAACLSSVVFAALHVSWVAFLPIWMLGVFLAFLYEETGSLAAPITVHVLHNTLMVCFMMFFKSLTT